MAVRICCPVNFDKPSPIGPGRLLPMLDDGCPHLCFVSGTRQCQPGLTTLPPEHDLRLSLCPIQIVLDERPV